MDSIATAVPGDIAVIDPNADDDGEYDAISVVSYAGSLGLCCRYHVWDFRILDVSDRIGISTSSNRQR